MNLHRTLLQNPWIYQLDGISPSNHQLAFVLSTFSRFAGGRGTMAEYAVVFIEEDEDDRGNRSSPSFR